MPPKPANRQDVHPNDEQIQKGRKTVEVLEMVKTNFQVKYITVGLQPSLICCFQQAYAEYFALHFLLEQIHVSGMIEVLSEEYYKNNDDNTKLVKNHIVAFQTLQQNY